MTNKKDRQSQLRAAIMCSILKSNLNITATPKEDDNGVWVIEVTGAIPQDYTLADEVAGIKVIQKDTYVEIERTTI